MKRIPIIVTFFGTACSEYTYTSKIQKDVFQQVRRNTVDILLVLDDSCSMYEEQESLATNFESFISAFAGADVDWQIGVTTTDTYYAEQPGLLLGGDDEVTLESADGRRINEVQWDHSWSYEEGVAMQLSADAYSATSNTIKGNWCLATETFGDGDLGSPGQLNHSCDGSSVEPEEEVVEDADPIEPRVGDIIFTEIMLDPSQVSDRTGEWLEMKNLSGYTLDLSGFALRDNGKNYAVFPEGTLVDPFATIVVGRSETDNGGISADVVFEDGLTLNNNVRILNSSMEDAEEIFEEMVMVGISGSGIEMGLSAAQHALSEPLISQENNGFLREEANLSLIFVSDEDDLSPMSTHDYLRFFTDLKGDDAYRNHSRMHISAVVGKDRPPYDGAESCSSSNGLGYYGPRYIELAYQTEGALESICDDFSSIAQELGLTASGLQLDFELSSPADPTSLIVKSYSEPSELAEDIEELVQDNGDHTGDYTYNAEKNTIEFYIDTLPASETYIVAEYRVLAEGTIVNQGASESSSESAE
ncbi:MAG: lamin tail domain-containing protein [Myxococcota bacterium]|nr:lamin tail domain-containing protein [Myxococcota bacterium]